MTSPAPRQLAWVGLGNMGMPMFCRVHARGYDVVTYDADPSRAADLPDGAVFASDGLPALAGADLIMLCLPDGRVVHDVLFGPGRLAQQLVQGAVVIDHSSSAPAETVRTGKQLDALGIHMIDAPVSGGVAGARSGDLTMMVGGSADHIEPCLPVFRELAARIIRVGDLGSGHAMKALNNFVSATCLLASLEALTVAKRFGIDSKTALDVLNGSTGRSHASETKIEQQVLTEEFASGFSLALMTKDLRTAAGMAKAVGIDDGLASACSALWQQSSDALPVDADQTEVGEGLGLVLGPLPVRLEGQPTMT